MTQRPPPSDSDRAWLRRAFESGALEVDIDRLADALLRREPAILCPPGDDEQVGGAVPLFVLAAGGAPEAPD